MNSSDERIFIHYSWSGPYRSPYVRSIIRAGYDASLINGLLPSINLDDYRPVLYNVSFTIRVSDGSHYVELLLCPELELNQYQIRPFPTLCLLDIPPSAYPTTLQGKASSFTSCSGCSLLTYYLPFSFIIR